MNDTLIFHNAADAGKAGETLARAEKWLSKRSPILIQESRHMPVKRIFPISLLCASSILTVGLPCVQAAAATADPSYHAIHAELEGKPFSAISVQNQTYIQWGALQVFKTPYEYLANGKFAITGGVIQGVVFHGTTYLPWAEVAAKVKAVRLKDGEFNFIDVPVSHDYHIVIDGSENVSAGAAETLQVTVLDGHQGVPHQWIHIAVTSTDGQAKVTPVAEEQDVTDKNGACEYALGAPNPATLTVQVTWKDPSGKQQTASDDITFKSAAATETPVPAGEQVVATAPVLFDDDAVYFQAQANNQTTMFQLDTGAYETLITKKLADALHLPNLGNVQIEGVGGKATAYNSEISLTIGGVRFNNIPCVVESSYTGTPLFGYRFFSDNGYDLLVSQKHNTLTILS
jgi:hypothetical protein